MKKKRDLMPARVKRAIKELTHISHKFVKDRDSISRGEPYRGYCCTCGKYCEASDYQAGHYEPNSTCGATLRFHPNNIHGQGGFCCNINRHGQQKMGNDYTMFMIRKYGLKRTNEIRALKNKIISTNIIWFEKLIELYKLGIEADIINFLEK